MKTSITQEESRVIAAGCRRAEMIAAGQWSQHKNRTHKSKADWTRKSKHRSDDLLRSD